MNEQLVKLLLSFCYLILIMLVAGCASYFIMKRQAKKLRAVFVRPRDTLAVPEKFVKPVRIAFVSDFHIPKMPPNKISVLNSIAKNSPDCIVIAGDLCENKKNIDETAEFVGAIASECNCPVIIVLGNHDIRDACDANQDKIKEYRRVLESAGGNIITLVDEKYVFECIGADRRILFGGLNDYRYNSKDKIIELVERWSLDAESLNSDFILVSHNPDAALHVPEKRQPSLVLSGHTHAGQMWLPFNAEFRFMRKDILPREGYKYGMHIYKEKFPIYITSGVGCSFLPIRFKSMAEVAIIDF